MCRIDDIDMDPPAFTAATIRRARKPHKCGECDREIQPGESYEDLRQVQSRGETPYRQATCLQCIEARKWLTENCGGWCFGLVAEDLREHEEEPAAVELARLMDARWLVGGALLGPIGVREIRDREVAA